MKKTRAETDLSHSRISRRAALLGGAQLLFIGGLAARMRYLQVEQADEFRLLADQEVPAMVNLTVGANEKNYHLQNVNFVRDFEVTEVADFRQLTKDDPCPSCGSAIRLVEGIEVGHIFKLGTSYSESMNAYYQDRDGNERPLVMGCYGIGVSRIVEARHMLKMELVDSAIALALERLPGKITEEDNRKFIDAFISSASSK